MLPVTPTAHAGPPMTCPAEVYAEKETRCSAQSLAGFRLGYYGSGDSGMQSAHATKLALLSQGATRVVFPPSTSSVILK